MRDSIANGEWDVVFNSLAKQTPPSRISLLWDIMMETDLNDLNLLEEKIYLYGKSLSAKDLFGRIVFTRMAMVLHNAQNVNV